MHIVCPHCTTSYAIKLATLGESGRTVRCSRCKEVWLARPEDAIGAAVPTMAAAPPYADSAAAEWEAMAQEEDAEQTPVVDSPSISADWPAEGENAEPDWPAVAKEDAEAHTDADGADGTKRRFHLPNLFRPGQFRLPSLPRIPFVPVVGALPATCAAMAALLVALLVWRNDVVRLLPQTALFYKMVGLEVNLRGLAFRDIKVTNETVDGKPVLVIEGMIVGQTRKPVELPRLRFSVRDAKGSEIYAWNAVLEQSVLKPGERAFFKSRLASPPSEGRNIDVRFFNKRDLVGGRA
ncbi:zinc-ribbon domain-containing protein [Bradyrhizobium sp. ISRA443]|uniref:MJ0042-type zinc finger domain-containing protein n=1 Tax=unclassified Bradyrhizobium TaxID=2631580 RepID=UPI0024795AF0|nr:MULTISPECIES: MJ0042-type zinc finger domain-containing protein [unclassified Bradyrhizobium]WGS00049.1 zinc-ribbon domain-containing protein [Bradyrhizobium sp. ISRA436]WGS06938.1 zinc-ribbon domain-containing protein [Bradyrhizobium sp. ISRA437]WGS13820.1 zinc-ribbon domain-containing protein [Bradyrhizobium sp. ISRA443]